MHMDVFLLEQIYSIRNLNGNVYNAARGYPSQICF